MFATKQPVELWKVGTAAAAASSCMGPKGPKLNISQHDQTIFPQTSQSLSSGLAGKTAGRAPPQPRQSAENQRCAVPPQRQCLPCVATYPIGPMPRSHPKRSACRNSQSFVEAMQALTVFAMSASFRFGLDTTFLAHNVHEEIIDGDVNVGGPDACKTNAVPKVIAWQEHVHSIGRPFRERR